jgi:hypothetical protein
MTGTRLAEAISWLARGGRGLASQIKKCPWSEGGRIRGLRSGRERLARQPQPRDHFIALWLEKFHLECGGEPAACAVPRDGGWNVD